MKTKASVLILGSTLTAGLFLTAGCVERRVVYVHDRPPGSPPPAEVVVTEAPPPGEVPPPPQNEVIVVAPGPNYVWIGGSWAWHGRWVWGSGHWVIAPHPHAVWMPGHWVRHRRGSVWVHGYWR